MSDITAGPSSGAQQGPTGPWGGGGSPPPVLLAAMGAAVLIAVTVMAFAIGSSSGGEDLSPASSGSGNNGSSSVAGDTDGRVRLRVVFDGDGGGEIKIAPAGIACSENCSNDIVTDTRVRVTADSDIGSTFKGWSDACDGTTSCAFYMDRSRELGVTFDKTQPAQKQGPDCDNDGLPDAQDPGSCDDPPPSPVGSTPAATGSDCDDGEDNDGDGLVDSAQDPGCDFGSEAATSKQDATDPDDLDDVTAPPPPPPAVPKDCDDGKDNDGDGLIDKAQDPGCDTRGTEADD